MDIIMPVLNGLDCARLIRKEEKEQHRARVPIIALSGNAQECDKSSALEAGMDDYLTKPHTRLELYSKLLCHVAPVTLD
jgi:CheY-like chemotaxis protein